VKYASLCGAYIETTSAIVSGDQVVLELQLTENKNILAEGRIIPVASLRPRIYGYGI
jgi:hypothetical protein